jgi:hypothetical protein
MALQDAHREKSQMTWYKNTSVWSVLVASSALVLSQLPPVASWFPTPDLQITHSDRAGINNAIGMLGMNLPVELHNVGNVDLSIDSLDIIQKNPSGKVVKLHAESFTKPATSGAMSWDFPISRISIPVGESWSEFVFFNRTVSPTDEEKFNKIRLDISQSIFDAQQSQDWDSFNPRAAVAANAKYVEEAISFFDEKFDLEKGKYAIDIVATTIDGRQFVQKSEITIYEYHIQALKSQTDDYKYGAGIYYPTNNSKQVWVKIVPE